MKVLFPSKSLRHFVLALAILQAGATIAKAERWLPAVGPASPSDSRSDGFLIVYSATREGLPACSDWNQNYYPHTPYTIYCPDLSLLRKVANGVGVRDEEPEAVALPAGRYVVHAQRAEGDWVYVPVTISPGADTIVSLDHRSRTPPRSRVR